MDIEEIVNHKLGGFGRTQWIVLVTLNVIVIFNGMPAVQDSFINYTPNYRCRVDACEDETTSYIKDFLNFSTPTDEKFGYSRCKMYKHSSKKPNSPQSALLHFKNNTCQKPYFSNDTIPCDNGYVFDTTNFDLTTVMQFGMVCDDEWKAPLITSMYNVGLLFGSLFQGLVSDKFGRKKALFVGLLLYYFGIVGAFSVNYYMLAACRCLVGIGAITVFSAGFIILAELMPVQYRSPISVSLNIPFAVGESCVGFLAMAMRDWHHLQLCFYAPGLICLISFLYLPESLRWLENQGREEELVKTIKKIAKINGVQPPQDLEIQNKQEEVNGDENNNININDSLRDLLSTWKMRTIILCMIYKWFAVNMVYYGMSQNAGNLGGNIYINFISMMLIEVPSYLLVVFFYDKFGHKRMLFFFLLICSIASIAAGLLPKDVPSTVMVVLAMVGKFGGAGSFGMLYMHTAEIFPTNYRSVGLGTCSMMGRVSGIVSPMIAGLGVKNKSMPLLIFGAFSCLSVVTCLFLPETAGLPLPQTVQDLDKFSEEGIFDFLLHWKRKSKKERASKVRASVNFEDNKKTDHNSDASRF